MKIEITPELLADLKENAKKATAGPWFYGKDAENIGWQHPDSNRVYANLRNQNNTIYGILVTVNYHVKSCDHTASFIAAANPTVMLALIDKIDQLEKESDWLAKRLTEFCDPDHDDQCCALCRKNCDNVEIKEWRNAAKEALNTNGQSITWNAGKTGARRKK